MESDHPQRVDPTSTSESVARRVRSPEPSGERTDPGREAPPGRAQSLLLLLGIVGAFAALYSAICELRYQEFYSANWDLGINMQMLWTTTHGHLLYEAGDWEVARANSFLFVHPTYVAIPMALVYQVWPFAGTLFIVQGLAVASAAIPLYLIGRDARVPDGVLFGGLVVYLLSFPVVSALLFDFHWEAFLPLEFLCTYYLWYHRHYWLALVPVLAGMLTLEVFPVLLIGVVAYFGLPYVSALIHQPAESLRRALRPPRRWLPLAGLLGVAILGHLVLSYITNHVLATITGASPIFPLASPYTWLGVYWWGLSLTDVGSRLLYWLLLLAAFGFLPLLVRQRLLILSLPWFVYSVVMVPYGAYTTVGFQYSFIAVGPLAIAFVEGLSMFRGWGASAATAGRAKIHPARWLGLLVPFFIASLTASLALITAATPGLLIGAGVGAATLALFVATSARWIGKVRPADREAMRHRSWKRGPSVVRGLALGAIVVLAASNLAMSPLDTANFRGPGYAGYSFEYAPNPVYPYLSQVLDRIPAGAPILASDNLFPYVANNARAYALLWYPATPPYLPFNSSNLPKYVLLSSSQWFAIPSFLSPLLFNQSDYGIVVLLYSTASYPGSVYLFELGYRGPPNVVEVSPVLAQRTLCGRDLSIGASGALVSESNSSCGQVIETVPASNLSGTGDSIWYGPYLTVLPGTYTVTVTLRGDFPHNTSGNPNVAILDASGSGSGYWYYQVITADEISLSHWTNFTYRYSLVEPYASAEWRGYVSGATVNGTFEPGFVELDDIEIQYTS